MDSFNQLLDQFVRRSGISDAELARTVGVSRQTIFRWREGQTARPRRREDVLLIAGKLRLAPEERDRLLLAAGFRPEEEIEVRTDRKPSAVEVEGPAPAPGEDAGPTPWLVDAPRLEEAPGESPGLMSAPDPAAAARTGQTGPTYRRPGPIWWPALAVGALALLGLVICWSAWRRPDGPPPTAAAISPVPAIFATPAPAAAGETVILITHFANYAGSQAGYNVAGRLTEALQREVDGARLAVQPVVWPEAAAGRPEALAAGRAVSATLVIYGEYDAGRVVVRFAHPGEQSLFAGPALQRHVADLPELAASLNGEVPEQVRSLALLALGQIYLQQEAVDQARALLLQARDLLAANPPVEAETLAAANFYLGVAYHFSQPPALDRAIDAYSKTIDAWPGLISARLNRAAAYERQGDLEQALADLDAVIKAAPDWSAPYNNRASIRIRLGGPENLALALADVDQALTLAPDFPEALLNRGYLRLLQGASMAEAGPDLEAAVTARPGYAGALNLLCWGYALEQQPEQAMPYCRQAIAADPQPAYRDSRGLAHALLGDYPAAIADFEAYTAWLEEQPASQQQPALDRRRAWLAALRAGQNPFTSQVLAELRMEIGP